MSLWTRLTNRAVKSLEADLENNPVDKAIIEHTLDTEHVDKAYQARWVWYHTILAGEILFTNLFLFIIIVMLGIIIGKM